jgi:hypothetical protein
MHCHNCNNQLLIHAASTTCIVTLGTASLSNVLMSDFGY